MKLWEGVENIKRKGNNKDEMREGAMLNKYCLLYFIFMFFVVFVYDVEGNVVIRKNAFPQWYIEENDMYYNNVDIETFIKSIAPNATVFVDSYAKMIRININGRMSVKKVLDTYSEYIDVDVNQNSIKISGFLVKTFEIPQFPVTYNYKQGFKSASISPISGGGSGGGSGGSGGSGGGSGEGEINIRSNQSFWDSIREEIQSILRSNIDSDIFGGGQVVGSTSQVAPSISQQQSAGAGVSSADTTRRLPNISGYISPSPPKLQVTPGGGGAPDNSFVSINNITSLVIVGTTKKKMQFVEKYINSIIDKIGETVEVELSIIEVHNNDDTEVGVSWQTVLKTMLFPNKTFVGNSPEAAISFFGNSSSLSINNSSNNVYGLSVSGLYNNTQQAIIQAMRKVTNLRIIDKTTILLRNNSAGGFTSGTFTSYIDSVSQSQTSGGNSSFSVQKGNILSGMDIVISATINQNKITLTITPSMSHLQKIESLQFSGVTVQNPTIDVRKSIATVTVTDGGTTAIIGYNASKEGQIKERMPLLGDIPLVGWLFGKTLSLSDSSSIVMLLTPRIKKL